MTGDRRWTLQSADGTTIGCHTIGDGPAETGLVVVGGALRTAQDYLPLARLLANGRPVHVIDRRGRGASGPQRPGHTIEAECADLQAVQAATGARTVFGHSYGGLIVLETLRAAPIFDNAVLYEPGVSIDGSIPTTWIGDYRRLLAAGHRRAAFALFIKSSGQLPRAVAVMPTWYLSAVMRLALRGPRWQQIDALQEANAVEHEQVAALDSTLASYRSVAADVLLLGGAKSAPITTTIPFAALRTVLPHSTEQILPGLDHNAPDEKAPQPVAHRIESFLRP